MGQDQGSCLKGIRWHAKNASKDCVTLSVVHSVLISWAMTLHNSIDLLPNYFVVRVFLQLSASIRDGPAPPLVLNAALFTNSASIPLRINGRIPFYMLPDKRFMASVTFPFLISRENTLEISMIDDVVIGDFKSFGIIPSIV